MSLGSLNPANTAQILAMMARGTSPADISAAVGMPITIIQAFATGHTAGYTSGRAEQPPSAPRDERFEALIVEAEGSPRARVRKAGERFQAAYDALLPLVAEDREQARLRRRADELAEELEKVRAQLKAGSRG